MKTVGIIACADHLFGGVYQYTLSMIDALKLDNRHRYIIITRPENRQFDNLKLEVRRVSASWNFARKLVRVLCLVLKLRNSFFLPKLERHLLSDIDLFICPIITPYPYYFSDKPFIFTFHDMQEKYFPHFFSMKERISRKLYAKALCSDASRIITESQYVKNDLIRYHGVDEGRVMMLPAPPPLNFLDSSTSTEDLVRIKTKYSLPDNFIFYPAQLWPHKNHVTLLEALAQIRLYYPDLCLVLTGSNNSEKISIDNKIASLGLTDAVYFIGFVDYLDLPAIYLLSRMLVMPSLFESISIPVYEAFALGIPVACSNVLALPEQVGKAGLLFDPLDSGDIAAKVISILENSKLRENLVANAYDIIRNYSHLEYMKRLQNLIDDVFSELSGG